MNIGYLNKNGEELTGEINTLDMQLSVRFLPIRERVSENAPHYAVVAIVPSGQAVEIGSAWKKTKQQIGDVMYEYLSITIDDPSLPSALNVAAFPNKTGGYDISWRRRRPKEEAA